MTEVLGTHLVIITPVLAVIMRIIRLPAILCSLLGVILASGSSYAQEIKEEMRKACLPAVDYEGCVRTFVNPPSPKEEHDFLGMPKIKEWLMVENRSYNTVYYVNEKAARVKVRGTFGRYITYEYLARWSQEATAGTQSYSMSVGSATTNCYGGGYGVINCRTTPAPTITIPGIASTPGGLMQKQYVVLIDCLERREQRNGEGRWEEIGEDTFSYSLANKWCGKIADLPESEIERYAGGTPSDKDILATKILPGSNPELIIREHTTR